MSYSDTPAHSTQSQAKQLARPPCNPSHSVTPTSSPEVSKTTLPSLQPAQKLPDIPSTSHQSDSGSDSEFLGRTQMAENTKSPKLNTEYLKYSGCCADYRAWRNTINLYMISNSQEFPDDKTKIAFTLSWMTGSKGI